MCGALVSDAPCAVWNKTAGMRHRLLTGHRGCVTSVAFFPSGDSLLTTGDDGTIRIWDARTGKEIRKFEEVGDSMSSVAVSPDGKVLAYGGIEGKIYVRALATGKLTNRVDTESTIRRLAFSPDGKVLGSCGYQLPTCLWDTTTGQRLHQFSEGCAALAFSSDGRTLATVSKLLGQGPNGSSIWAIRLRDGTTGRLLRQFGERNEYATGSDKLLWINSIAMSPDGQLLVTAGSEPQIHFWHTATGKKETSLKSLQESVDCLAFSPDGKVLASGATDGTVCLWDVTSGKRRQRFKAHRSAITSVQFAPDGKRLATGSMDSTAVVWDLKPTSSALYLSLLGFGLRVLAQTPTASI
jgi:WD40 repeat protein